MAFTAVAFRLGSFRFTRLRSKEGTPAFAKCAAIRVPMVPAPRIATRRSVLAVLGTRLLLSLRTLSSPAELVDRIRSYRHD